MQPVEPLQKSIEFNVGDTVIYLPTSEKAQIVDMEPLTTGMPSDKWRLMIIQMTGTKILMPVSTAIASRYLRKPIADFPS